MSISRLTTLAVILMAIGGMLQSLNNYFQGEKIRQLQDRVSALEAAP